MTMQTDTPARKLTPRQVELVALMRAEDNLARFGSAERIPDWPKLKAVMELLGGKWQRAPQAFAFPEGMPVDAMLREAVATGEVPDPRAAGFFETPRPVGDRLVGFALTGMRPDPRVLEPNGGRGALAELVRERAPQTKLTIVELLERNRAELARRGFGEQLAPFNDFLAAPADFGPFDAVVMNPPFAGGADVAHVTKAIDVLAPRGRLAAVMSAGVSFRGDRKTVAFRKLLERHGALVEDLPPGSFRESGTMVNTVIVRLVKGGR